MTTYYFLLTTLQKPSRLNYRKSIEIIKRGIIMKKYFYTFVAVLSFTILTSSLLAQAQEKKNDMKFTEQGITNLETAIKSDNPGLKKSAIFMAGKYQVVELEDLLIDELKSQNNTEIKLLIANVLHKMYSEKGMMVLEDFAKDSSDKKMQKFASLLITDYNNSKLNVVQN
jgi:hypothetical protein